MATRDQTYKLEICTDCYMFAHGVLEEPEDFEVPHISRAQAFKQFGDMYIVGTNHDNEITGDRRCRNDDECCCDEPGFSWNACHTCGMQLGGDRHSVVILTLGS